MSIVRSLFTANVNGSNIFQWVQTPAGQQLQLLNGLANIVWAEFSTMDCDEITLLCTNTIFANENAHAMRVQWSADVDPVFNPSASQRWCNDSFVTTAQAAGTNTVVPFINEWVFAAGANTIGSGVIQLPVAGMLCRIGVYCQGATAANQSFQVDVQPVRTTVTQP